MTSATSIPEYESQLNGLVRKNREACPPCEVARQLLADDRSGHMAVFDRPGPGGSGVVSQETRRLQAQRFSPEAEDNPNDAYAPLYDDTLLLTTFGWPWPNRFKEGFRISLTYNSNEICGLARKQGNSITLEALESQNKQDVSEPTANRFIGH